MFRGTGGRLDRLVGTAFLAWLPLALLTACSNDDPVTETALPPSPVSVQISANVDTVTVTWTASATALSYRVELTGGSSDITETATATETSLVLTSGDGVEDGVTYSASVVAVNQGGETASSNNPTATTNFFPWDEYFATSLHRTGQGKQTFYDEVPNGGFETYVQVPYEQLACRGCHTPGLGFGTVKGERGCLSCHDTDNPTLGAKVEDASLDGVCGVCHSRQKAEAFTHGYADVHRDAGMGCMDCHTLEDVHGDGTAYASMLEDGAIDAQCSNCHVTLPSNPYHNVHSELVDCTVCHTKSVVTCNNCHIETELETGAKLAYAQFSDWNFLLNRNGKVHTGNYQSVVFQDKAIVAFGPFYAHTIVKNAVTGCGNCHGNAAVEDWFDDGVIDVVTYDESVGDPNGKNLKYMKGIIPIPPNFFDGGLRYDFVTLTAVGSGQWEFLKTGADIYQMLYATPLTQEQMDKLK
jgi:hypothetical protein